MGCDFTKPPGILLIDIFYDICACQREWKKLLQMRYLRQYFKLLALVGAIPFSTYKYFNIQLGWQNDARKISLRVARILWSELALYSKDGEDPDILKLSEVLDEYPAIHYNWLERAYLQEDSEIIRMELRENKYIVFIYRQGQEGNDLFVIPADTVNSVDIDEECVEQIWEDREELGKIGAVLLAEGIKSFPCVLEDIDEYILYYDLPNRSDCIGEYKMDSDKKGLMKTPNFFWSHTFWHSLDGYAYWSDAHDIIFHSYEEGKKKLAILPKNCNVQWKKNRIELCFTRDSIFYERIFYDLDGNSLGNGSRVDQLEDMWWLIVNEVIPPGFRQMTDTDIDLLRRYHDNFCIKWIREKINERESLASKKEKTFLKILLFLEQHGYDEKTDILKALQILVHYTFRVLEEAFTEDMYFSESFYNILEKAAGCCGCANICIKLEDDPESFFGSYCYRTEEEFNKRKDALLYPDVRNEGMIDELCYE